MSNYYVDEVDGVFFIDRTAATDEEFRARFDRFGIFDEERAVEEVARVLFAATPDRHVWDNATNLGQHQRDEARRLARAAITEYRAMS